MTIDHGDPRTHEQAQEPHPQPQGPELAVPTLETPVVSRRALLLGGGLAAVGLVGLGARLGGQGRSPAPRLNPENSAATTAGATSPNKTATAEVPTIQKLELEDSEVWQGLSQARQEQWKHLAYELKDDAFDKLPNEERARFSKLTYDLVEPYVTAMLQEFDPNYEPLPKASKDESNRVALRRVDTTLTAAYLMLTKNGDPATFRDPSVKNLDNWVFLAKRYIRGLYISPHDNPDLTTVQKFLDGTAPLGLDLRKMCDGGCYYGMKPVSDEIVRSGDDCVIRYSATYSDKTEIEGHYKAATFTPLDNKPGDTTKDMMWQMGAMYA